MLRVVAERMSLHWRIAECANCVDESKMCIYVDGMDQDKTWIPKFPYTETDKSSFETLPSRYGFQF
jgi:hypothetical protein